MTMKTDTQPTDSIEAKQGGGGDCVSRLVVPLRRRNPMLGLLALSALAMMPSMGGGPLAADIRNDPDREKTDEDLKRMDAAQRKRERKADLRSRHNS